MYLGVLGMGYNTELLAKKKLAAPACWRDLTKPELVVFFADDTEDSLPLSWAAISTRLALHEHEFDVILDDRVRFVRLTEKPSAAGYLILGVGDLVPDDRREIVESNFFATLLDRCVKRDNGMPAVVFLPRKTDITNVDDQSSPWDETKATHRNCGCVATTSTKKLQESDPPGLTRFRRRMEIRFGQSSAQPSKAGLTQRVRPLRLSVRHR